MSFEGYQSDSDRIKPLTWWKPKTKENPQKPYKVLHVDFDGVAASTPIQTATAAEDSFVWFGPAEEFLSQFAPIQSNK